MSTPDVGILAKMADWIWGALAALIGVVWKMLNSRIDTLHAKVEELDKTKATNAEMDKQRANISALFDGQTELRKEMSEGFKDMSTLMHTLQGQIIDKLDRKQDKRR